MAIVQTTQIAIDLAIRFKIHVHIPAQHIVLHRRMVIIRVDVFKAGRRKGINSDEVSDHVSSTRDAQRLLNLLKPFPLLALKKNTDL